MHGPKIRATLYGPPYLKPKPPSPRIVPSPRIEAALATPTWSVRSLLPLTSENASASGTSIHPSTAKEEITREKLHHLLNLSALPLPKTKVEEDSLLQTLRAQIHFVREIQKVDTTGVEPLRAIRDETAEQIEEETVTLDDLQEVFDREEVVGRNGRIRRKTTRDNAGNEIAAVDDESDRAMRWNCFEMGEVLEETQVTQVDGSNTRSMEEDLPEMVKGEVPGRRSGKYFVVRKAGQNLPGKTTIEAPVG